MLNRSLKLCVAACVAAAGSSTCAQDQNLAVNAAFLDVDMDGAFGDGWGVFGSAAVDFEFFGDGNPGHATLFGDNLGNIGGVFQAGIPATPGTEYTVSFRIQWESEWDARTLIGFEFYASDDATQLSQELVEIVDEPAGDGYRRFDFTATAPANAAFVRPIAVIDLVNSAGANRACTVDNVVVRESNDVLTLNPSFGDLVNDGNNGDFWSSFGAVAFDLDFFNNGNPGHATFFGDNPMNEGFMWQQSIEAVANETYTFEVDMAFEENWAADTFIAIEYYGEDDAFLVGVDEIEITENPGAGYETFRVTSTAPDNPFLKFVRPLVRFANPIGGAGSDEAATIDNGVLRIGAVVPMRLCADINADGILNGADFNAWLAAFAASSSDADQNFDGVLNGADFNAWLSNFSAGNAGPECDA